MIKWPTVFVDQFLKDVDKVPGWVPLYLTVFFCLEYLSFPPALSIQGQEVELSIALAASILTFVLYQLGDGVDEYIYKVRGESGRDTRPIFLRRYLNARQRAEKALGQTAGIYALSLALVRTAEKDRSTLFIHVPNELAKYFRSLAIASLMFGVFALISRDVTFALLSFAAGLIFIFAYPWLKVYHTRKLYYAAAELATSPTFRGALAVRELEGVRILFWKGRLVIVSAA